MKILVPLDGSKFAEAALEPAVKLANETNADVYLLQVISSEHTHITRARRDAPEVPARDYLSTMGISGGVPYSVARAPRQSAVVESRDGALEREVQTAEDYLFNLDAHFPPRKMTHRVVVGEHVAEDIRAYAEKVGADMVVMATHGRTGVGRILMGSVTTDLLRHSTVPVLVVRPPNLHHGQGS